MNTNLPIHAHINCIVNSVRENKATVIVAPTGSGKSTQVPQALLAAGFGQCGMIGVTQPRRIAAVSLAKRIAREMEQFTGNEIGYQIRFDDVVNPTTKVKLMTEGILLREASLDPALTKYKVIILDEAHERGLNLDICLGLVKRALEVRSDLRVVVMSATIDAGKFSAYFSNAPIIHVEGRTFPITTSFLSKEDLYVSDWRGYRRKSVAELAAEKLAHITTYGEPGDVLIFMPGKGEIEQTIQSIKKMEMDGILLLPLHGEQPMEEQERIFQPSHLRKVTVATNVAEASITPDGVVHVINAGLVRQPAFNHTTGIGSLNLIENSMSGLKQGGGRAGRTKPGYHHLLMTEEEYFGGRREHGHFGGERQPFTLPEILRSDLAHVILLLISANVSDVRTFEFIDQPDHEAFINALTTLKELGAIDDEEKLTPIGQRLISLPVDPRIGRMIVAAQEYGCIDEVVMIAAALSVRTFFYYPQDKMQQLEARAVKAREFDHPLSDFLTLLNVASAFTRSGFDRSWAREKYLNSRALEEADMVYSQLRDVLERSGVEISSIGYQKPENSHHLTDEEKTQAELVGKAVMAGYISNLAVNTRGYGYSPVMRYGRTLWGGEWYIHPSSAAFSASHKIVVAAEVFQTPGKRYGTKTNMRNCMKVELPWLEELRPDLVQVKEVDSFFSRRYRVTSIGDVEIAREELAQLGYDPDMGLLQTIDSCLRRLSVVRADDGFMLSHGPMYLLVAYLEMSRNSLLLRPPSATEELNLNTYIRAAEEVIGNHERYLVRKEEARRQSQRLKEEAAERERLAAEAAVAEEERLKKINAQQATENELELIESYRGTPGFGQYSFEIDERDDPLPFKRDGNLYAFDWGASDQLPEKGRKYWGFINRQEERGSLATLYVALIAPVRD